MNEASNIVYSSEIWLVHWNIRLLMFIACFNSPQPHPHFPHCMCADRKFILFRILVYTRWTCNCTSMTLYACTCTHTTLAPLKPRPLPRRRLNRPQLPYYFTSSTADSGKSSCKISFHDSDLFGVGMRPRNEFWLEMTYYITYNYYSTCASTVYCT